jgi:hypothetical protein
MVADRQADKLFHAVWAVSIRERKITIRTGLTMIDWSLAITLYLVFVGLLTTRQLLAGFLERRCHQSR